MNRLNTAKRARVIAALVEGASINAIVRMTPAMESDISNHVWALGELVELLDVPEMITK
jgi:hypothetical protein